MIWTALLFNRFTAAALALSIAAAGFYAYRGSLIQKGYDQAMSQVREAETDRLRELIKENSRLVALVKGLSDVAEKQKQDIQNFRARQRADADKLRSQEAEHQRRLAAATAEAAAKYATHLDGHLEECRDVVADFAGEAAACASTAWQLKNYQDALP